MVITTRSSPWTSEHCYCTELCCSTPLCFVELIREITPDDRQPHHCAIWIEFGDQTTPSSWKNTSRDECYLLFGWRPAGGKHALRTDVDIKISCCCWLSGGNSHGDHSTPSLRESLILFPLLTRSVCRDLISSVRRSVPKAIPSAGGAS